MRLNQKPFSILVFYLAASITLLALIIAFAVIKNPSSMGISVEFATLFIAEWGIQIIGASQSASALELVALMKTFSTANFEYESRKKFNTIRRSINIGLILFAIFVVSLPISYIIRSSIIYHRDEKNLLELY